MSEEQKKLSEGIAALVRHAPHGEVVYSCDESDAWHPERKDHTVAVYDCAGDNPAPLSPLQTLALAVLIDPSTAGGSALIDALIEAGVITQEWEDMIRADERERCIKVCEIAADTWMETARIYIDRTRDELARRRESQSRGAILLADLIRRSA